LAGNEPIEQVAPRAAGHSEKVGARIALLLRSIVADTWRALIVLDTQIEYSIAPPAHSSEPLRTTWAVTQIAPAGGGLAWSEGDGDGLADFEGDGEGDEVFVGLVFDGDGVALALGLEGGLLPEGLGLPDGLLLDGLGLGLPVEVGLTLAEVVALTDGLVSANVLACSTVVDPPPHTEPSGMAWAALAFREGAITGPVSRNSPAPATTAARPARTTLTGTAALRW